MTRGKNAPSELFVNTINGENQTKLKLIHELNSFGSKKFLDVF